MPTDPHRGGTLSEMAAGTSIPNDAGIQNTIPSVPRPDQKAENSQFTNQGLAEPSAAFAADNETEIPQGTRDLGAGGEVITGTGNTLPATVESKRNDQGLNYPGGKA